MILVTGRQTHGGIELVRVLVADDCAAVRAVLRDYIKQAFSEESEIVGEASDGISAVELARLYEPNVVIMDVKMPGLDGIQATRILRAGIDCRVILCSSFDAEETEALAKEAGVDAYLLKPFDLEALKRVVYGLIQYSSRASE